MDLIKGEEGNVDKSLIDQEDSLAYYARLQEKGFDLRHWEELERRKKIADYEGTRIGDWGFDLMDFRMIIQETNKEFGLIADNGDY